MVPGKPHSRTASSRDAARGSTMGNEMTKTIASPDVIQERQQQPKQPLPTFYHGEPPIPPPQQNYGWSLSQTPQSGPPVGPPFGPPGGPPYQWVSSCHGAVPPGAVHAGVDKNGEPLYVGRTRHEHDIVPAKIVPSHQCAYVAWGGQEHRKEHYEALCAPQVSWMSDSNGAVPYGAVPIGTTTDGETLFVGRVRHDGTLTPGKIHASHGVCYIPYGGEELHFSEYEVLVIY